MADKVADLDLKAPWDRQIEFFRQKLNLPTEAWDEILREVHDRAFVVAGAMKADLLNDLRGAVDRAISEGKSLGWFRQEFQGIAQAHGWDYQGPKNWRTRVIYQTNLSTSYHAGRYQQLTDPELVKLKPFRVYHHGHPATPRPEHLAWDGIALPWDHPWWRTHYTPNGFGCTCWVSAASQREIEARGWKLLDQAPDDGTYRYTVPRTGEVVTLPKGVDYGWDYAPGASVAEQLRPVVEAKLKSLPKPLADALKADVAPVMESPKAAAREFVRNCLEAPKVKQPPLDLGITARHEVAGIAVEGKAVALDHDYTRHALLHHGTEKERLRGQEPITAGDLALALDLFDHPNAVIQAGDPPQSKNGAARLALELALAGWRYGAIYEVRRARVVLYTLYKRAEKK